VEPISRFPSASDETPSPTLSGSGESFGDFFGRRRAGAVRLSHAIVGSNEVAEEIAQEAFLRMHERWLTIERPEQFLRVVVVNLCRTHLRRARLERREASRFSRTTLDPPEIDETWEVVCRLPFRQRAVLALRYYADLPDAEIADLLGCRVGTVKSAHHRALATLRKELK
jgi:RNA polymerase sigma factor (sigma-70 family)